MTQLTKKEVIDDRPSETIDVSKEPDLYFAKLAYETHGNAIRDNSLTEWVSIGMDIERES